MKEAILDLILTILSDFNVPYDTWKKMVNVVDKKYLNSMEKTTIDNN